MKIAVIDADLISRRNHRFPNLASMKISGWHKDRGDEVELKTEYERLDGFDKIYISKVFTSTDVPEPVLAMNNVIHGGTGFYFGNAPDLPAEMEHHFPDYHLYANWVQDQIKAGVSKQSLKYYTDYSLGYLTRGCFRKCPFCVNKSSLYVSDASPLTEFYDPMRKKICMLDDNFLGHPRWKKMLGQLKKTGRPFQFNQGLDERILTEEMCRELFTSNYDGDYTFAFDWYNDKGVIKEKIDLIKKHTKAIIKFYCFTGFDRNGVWDQSFWERDIRELFLRIEILMKEGYLPYVMRHEGYRESLYRGMYITVARWCNQPGLFKKKSLREFGILNGKDSACNKYLMEFEKEHEYASYFYDLKYSHSA